MVFSRPIAVAAIVACSFFLRPCQHALAGTDFGGSIRSIAGLLDTSGVDELFNEDDSELLSQSILRLTWKGRPSRDVRYELHGVQTFTYVTTPGGPSGISATGTSSSPISLGGFASRRTRYRALDLTWRWRDESRTAAGLLADRANVTFRLGDADLKIGRQAITFGKTYFWNVLDVFLPFDPEQFDRDYKPGVDAVRLDLALGNFSGLTFVAAAGPTVPALSLDREDDDIWESSWFGSAALARAYTTTEGWDFSLQAGKVYGGYHIGAGATGEFGPIAARIEAAQHFADDSPPLAPAALASPGLPPSFAEVFDKDLIDDATSIVVGAGHRFENSFTIETEYFHNGAADGESLLVSALRSSSGSQLNLSEDLAGVAFSYEFTPLVLGSIGTIVSFDDGSAQVLPRITWSAADEIEVLFGAIVHAGDRPAFNAVSPALRSEFGLSPDLYFAEAKYYF